MPADDSGSRLPADADGSDGSSSDSSDSSSSSRERKRKKKERKKKERKEKRRKRKEDKEKKQKKQHKRASQRSIITGKKIKRQDGSVADEAGAARRAMLLAQMNEGEDADYAAPPKPSSRQADAAERLAAARADPKLMLQMMQQSADAQHDKRRRLAAMKRGGGGGDVAYDADYAVAKVGQIDAPNNYKRQRAANEAADYLKPDGAF